MRRSSLTPADRRHFAAILFIGAAVFLLIALLFFRAGAIDSKKSDPEPTKTPSSSTVSPTPDTEPSPDAPADPEASEPPEDTDTPESPEPSETLPTPSPTPDVDLYERLDFRPSTMFNEPETYVVSSPDGELNVRSGPSTAYEKLGQFYTGTPVTVYTIENGWALVMFEERYAWCSANYLISPSEE